MLRRMGHRFIIAALCILALISCDGEEQPVTPFGTLHGPPPIRQVIAENQPREASSSGPVLQTAPGWSFDSDLPGRPRTEIPRIEELPGWHFVPRTVSPRVGRMVVADEDIIGIDCGDDHCIALSGHGGVFRTIEFGDWTPKDSDLPRLRQVYFDGHHILACPEDARLAWYSQDRGEHWSHLDFPCGADGEPAHLDGVFSVLVQANHFRFGAMIGGRYEWLPLPVETVDAVYSDWARLLFFTPDGIVRSDGGDHRFSLSETSVGLRYTRAVVGDEKGMIVAVGDARDDAPVSISMDGGHVWYQPEMWPAHVQSLESLYLAPDRRIVATSDAMPFSSFESSDLGKTWQIFPMRRRPVGGISSLPGALVFATDRGIGFSPHTDGVRPLRLNQPLVRATYIQPRVVIGAGLYGGLFRSVDGGETWYSIPETHGFVFVDVVHLGGNQLVAWAPDTLRISIDGGEQWFGAPRPENCEIEELIGRDGLIVLRCLDGRFATVLTRASIGHYRTYIVVSHGLQCGWALGIACLPLASMAAPYFSATILAVNGTSYPNRSLWT